MASYERWNLLNEAFRPAVLKCIMKCVHQLLFDKASQLFLSSFPFFLCGSTIQEEKRFSSCSCPSLSCVVCLFVRLDYTNQSVNVV